MPPNQPSASSGSVYPSCGPQQQQQQHEDELESLFQPQQFHQGPCFQLSSWSSGSTEATTTPTTTITSQHVKSGVSLPFANIDHHSHENSDGDDDDSMSCDWSMESDDDEDDSVTEAKREAEKVLEESSQQHQQRRVRFSDCIFVRSFQKAEVEDVPQLYYSAHELQKMIDEYILEQRRAAAALDVVCPNGGSSSSSSPVPPPVVP